MKLPDKRNKNILININGELLPRNEAKVSVFDSSVQGGDAVWEGLRVYKGRIAALNDHLICLLYTSPSPRDGLLSRMPSSA